MGVGGLDLLQACPRTPPGTFYPTKNSENQVRAGREDCPANRTRIGSGLTVDSHVSSETHVQRDIPE